MKTRSALHLVALIGAVALCLGELLVPRATAQDKKVSWIKDVLPVLSRDCTGADCHGSGFKAEELDLEDEPYAAIVKKKSVQAPKLFLIQPKSVKESYLWHKMTGTHKSDEVKGKGESMPLSRGPLDKKDLELIKAWIEQGAEKN